MTDEERAKSRGYQRRYDDAHREEINARRRERYATDPDFRASESARHRRWYEKHLEERRAYNRSYADAHRDELRIYKQTHKEIRRRCTRRDDAEVTESIRREALRAFEGEVRR